MKKEIKVVLESLFFAGVLFYIGIKTITLQIINTRPGGLIEIDQQSANIIGGIIILGGIYFIFFAIKYFLKSRRS